MKFSCAIVDILPAVQLASRAIGSQQALPILGNILISVRGDVCTLTATDLELSIVTSIPARVEVEGSITVPAKALLNYVQYNNDVDILFEVKDGTQIHCSSAKTKVRIAGESANDYPSIAAVEEHTSLVIEGNSLLQALELVTFAASKTSLRPVLAGVSIRREGDSLILVATDSYRLSEYTLPFHGEDGGDLSCIVPVKILEELRSILLSHTGEKKSRGKEEKSKDGSEEEFEVRLSLSRQQVEVSIGSVRLLSRLIDGKFPDYRQIIPKEVRTTVVFTTADLSLAVKRAHYFAKDANNNLTFTCTNNETKIVTPQTQSGREESTLIADVTGDEGKIALSSSYILDFLHHIEEESVVMRLAESSKPALFTLPGNTQFLHLVMPLRMQEE